MTSKRILVAGTLCAVLACGLSFPRFSFAVVRVDQTELAQGENVLGAGRATLVDSDLSMRDVTANEFFTDENLIVRFNGGNNIENVNVTGSTEVDLSFTGENEVEEVHASGESDVTINANGHNEFEEIEATKKSNVTINVTGENDFEEITGRDDANITVRGTECQKKDVVNLGEDEEDTALTTERGTLTVDHVTVNLKGEESYVGSSDGNVVVDTSKIAKDDGNKYALVSSGGTMEVRESVIDIVGTIYAKDKLTIQHSDVKAQEPDSKYGDKSSYRVWSNTGVELIDEKNGEVREGEHDGNKVFFVDTDDNNGKNVNLKADGEPAYYKCANDDDSKSTPTPTLASTPTPTSVAKSRVLPKTGDASSALVPMASVVGAVALALGARQRARK